MDHNIIVLDLETRRSADDCRYCCKPMKTLDSNASCGNSFTHCAIGWDNKAALGLSVGCYYSSSTQKITWFDEASLETTVSDLTYYHGDAILVSFNGIGFDFPLMCELLRERHGLLEHNETTRFCVAFEERASESYDILAEIWKADPEDRFARSNSLDAISQANGLGAKLSHGAQVPRDWAAGRWANVLNYCADDVYKTKALFDLVASGQPLQRPGKAPLYIRDPFIQEKP